jgi:hypothetical protein
LDFVSGLSAESLPQPAEMLEVTATIVWTTAVASDVRFRDIHDSPRRR